jgi:hypothetical protein
VDRDGGRDRRMLWVLFSPIPHLRGLPERAD